MVQRARIEWKHTAKNEKFEIFAYWNKRNKSKLYSLRLDEKFNKAINNLLNYPEIGQKTNFENVRILIVEKFFIFYEIFDDKILISKIWDSRRNPQDLSF